MLVLASKTSLHPISSCLVLCGGFNPLLESPWSGSSGSISQGWSWIFKDETYHKDNHMLPALQCVVFRNSKCCPWISVFLATWECSKTSLYVSWRSCVIKGLSKQTLSQLSLQKPSAQGKFNILPIRKNCIAFTQTHQNDHTTYKVGPDQL